MGELWGGSVFGVCWRRIRPHPLHFARGPQRGAGIPGGFWRAVVLGELLGASSRDCGGELSSRVRCKGGLGFRERGVLGVCALGPFDGKVRDALRERSYVALR